MTLAFIPEYLADNFIALYAKITIVAFCWGLVGVAMAIDFGYGIRKAKEIGEARTSEGYRRTVKKASEYYTVMTFAFIFDALISFVTYLKGLLNYNASVAQTLEHNTSGVLQWVNKS